MEEEYSITEKVGKENKKYVSVSIKIHKIGDKGYVRDVFPWHRLWIPYIVKENQEVYVVIYIQHSGEDHSATAFFKESDARKYIKALKTVISNADKTDTAEVHYNNGVESLNEILDLPLNSYVSFRTPSNEYSITLAKTTYHKHKNIK